MDEERIQTEIDKYIEEGKKYISPDLHNEWIKQYDFSRESMPKTTLEHAKKW